MPKIVFTERLKEGHLGRISALMPGWTIIDNCDVSENLSVLTEAEILSGFLKPDTIKLLLATENNLKWIHVWSAGVDGMPLDEIARQGVTLTNSSGVHANGISEVVLALMLALSRRLQISIRKQAANEWDPVLPLTELNGKTLGILGVGAIGRQTASVAAALGMHVLGLNRSGRPCKCVDKMYKVEEIAMLLPQCDYIVNILPLTDHTYHLIGENEFIKMNRDAIYINVGRGGTTDTKALITALEQGYIAAAGLDVFEEEPLSRDSVLWQMEQVIITAHNAGMTPGYVDKVMDILSDNIGSYLQSGAPRRNVVDLKLGY